MDAYRLIDRVAGLRVPANLSPGRLERRLASGLGKVLGRKLARSFSAATWAQDRDGNLRIEDVWLAGDGYSVSVTIFDSHDREMVRRPSMYTMLPRTREPHARLTCDASSVAPGGAPTKQRGGEPARRIPLRPVAATR